MRHFMAHTTVTLRASRGWPLFRASAEMGQVSSARNQAIGRLSRPYHATCDFATALYQWTQTPFIASRTVSLTERLQRGHKELQGVEVSVQGKLLDHLESRIQGSALRRF